MWYLIGIYPQAMAVLQSQLIVLKSNILTEQLIQKIPLIAMEQPAVLEQPDNALFQLQC